MGELEFAKKILKILDTNILQMTIKKAVTQGFAVQGFTKNVWLAPETMIIAALEKKKRGKYQSSIFLEALSGLSEENEAVILAKKWMQNGEARVEAENEIQQIQTCKIEQKRKILNTEIKKKQDDRAKENDENDEKIEQQQQLRIKKLQSTIQDLRIGTENQQKKVIRLQKENAKLEKRIEEKEELNVKLSNQIEDLKEEIKQLEKKFNMSKQENLNYQEIFKKVPRVICFSKKTIDKKIFPFHNIEQLYEWKDEYEKAINWNDYREIWVIETDFNYPEVLKIKKSPCKKIVMSHNVKALIEKVGGIR